MVRRLHRLNALILLVFIAIHFANHLIGLTGLANHIAIMEMLRSVYRVQIVEILIFFLFFSQIALGLLLITKRGKPQGNWAWAQIISGGLIGFFLLQHLSAVIMMRLTYAQLDTNPS